MQRKLFQEKLPINLKYPKNVDIYCLLFVVSIVTLIKPDISDKLKQNIEPATLSI